MNKDIHTTDAQGAIDTRLVPVTGPLREHVRALMAVEVKAAGPLPFAVVPHDSVMLSVQFSRDGARFESKQDLGDNTRLTGIRRWTGSFVGAGNCLSLFAVLSPLGAMVLLDSQPLDAVPRIRARVSDLLDHQLARALEDQITQAEGIDMKLMAFARWLEERACATRQHAPAALRAGRAAMHLCAQPNAPMEEVADRQHVSRRQLERDFARYIGTSPRHLAQVARVQWVSRKAQTGASLADIAADVGFADQAHMSRAVRHTTGLTPQQFVRTQRSPIATAFRTATGGGTVYL
jgi:AraC-like DNA-binding protein